MLPTTVALIVEIIQALMAAATALPTAITAGETAIGLLQSNADPTPVQEAAIRSALDAANATLQGS